MTTKRALQTAGIASLLVHVVLLDLWRGQVGEGVPAHLRPASRLEGRLSEPVPAPQLAPPQTPTQTTVAAPALAQPSVAPSLRERRLQRTEPAVAASTTSEVDEAGAERTPHVPMRPWSKDEGVAGYRLALAGAAVWPSSEWDAPSPPNRAVVLRLRLSAAGVPAQPQWLQSSGSEPFDAAAIAWLSQAAARAPIPEVLRGSDFELDVLIE